MLPPHIQQFFTDRKISAETLADFQIGYNGKIVYPVFDINGIKIFNLYRRDPNSVIGPRFSYDRGAHLSLYGIDKIKNEKTIVIGEGLNDMLCLWSAGIPAVTSTGGAMSFAQEWAELFKGKEVIACLDGDQAGGEGMARIWEFIPTAKFVFIPEIHGMKDICDIASFGNDLHKVIGTARSFLDLEEIKEDRDNRVALWQPTWFHDAILNKHKEVPEEEKTKKSHFSGDNLTRAKQFPINQLIKFNKDSKACCIWHTESGPSLHYYKKNNRVFCFACHKGGDSIDVYRQLNNCSLSEAIKFLS